MEHAQDCDAGDQVEVEDNGSVSVEDGISKEEKKAVPTVDNDIVQAPMGPVESEMQIYRDAQNVVNVPQEPQADNELYRDYQNENMPPAPRSRVNYNSDWRINRSPPWGFVTLANDGQQRVAHAVPPAFLVRYPLEQGIAYSAAHQQQQLGNLSPATVFPPDDTYICPPAHQYGAIQDDVPPAALFVSPQQVIPACQAHQQAVLNNQTIIPMQFWLPPPLPILNNIGPYPQAAPQPFILQATAATRRPLRVLESSFTSIVRFENVIHTENHPARIWFGGGYFTTFETAAWVEPDPESNGAWLYENNP
ncbi:hypothetical protein CC80DRAFT_554867 [Byssothecium circinans]|uniref:Uncharacterized protein n=1 Tax=Byssothecium circinans TaxID=147558 RepID=A0A6A5TGM6_9PLEO|nr:hypothetical protein CC80DRAFT_554867 [Byssothecium circinans]